MRLPRATQGIPTFYLQMGYLLLCSATAPPATAKSPGPARRMCCSVEVELRWWLCRIVVTNLLSGATAEPSRPVPIWLCPATSPPWPSSNQQFLLWPDSAARCSSMAPATWKSRPAARITSPTTSRSSSGFGRHPMWRPTSSPGTTIQTCSGRYCINPVNTRWPSMH